MAEPWEDSRLPLHPGNEDDVRNQSWWKDMSLDQKRGWWDKFCGGPESAGFWIEADDGDPEGKVIGPDGAPVD